MASGKCGFIPYCVSHLTFVNGFHLLATAEVTKETNFFKG